jgi:hypothetical protein
MSDRTELFLELCGISVNMFYDIRYIIQFHIPVYMISVTSEFVLIKGIQKQAIKLM